MYGRTARWGWLLSLVIAWGFSSTVYGQAAPDIRAIRPVIMLMVDTSGSMERLPGCVCSTAECLECLPSCTGINPERNRWAIVLEALTGRWDAGAFSCTLEDRNVASYIGQPDYGYFLPHVKLPTDTGRSPLGGILQENRDKAKFGLMTFDGVSSLTSAPLLIEATTFSSSSFLAQSTGRDGMFSYGEPKPLFFPGCIVDYMVDNGAKNEAPDGLDPADIDASGRLVSVGNESDDFVAVNDRIASTLDGVRPFGPTPIAGMLEDLKYYLDTHPDVGTRADHGALGDPYAACREKAAILITDGYPNADFRGEPFGCDDPGDPRNTCPYELPEDTARDLCALTGGSVGSSTASCSGPLSKGLHVVGFDVADPDARARLEAIALEGGTEVIFADADPPSAGEEDTSLAAAIASIIGSINPSNTTRTLPAISRGSSGSAQFQFNTGFEVGEGSTDPWKGTLDRRRFVCNGLVAEEVPLEAEDFFHDTLNARSTARNIFTVIPTDPLSTRSMMSGRGAEDIPSSLTDVGDLLIPAIRGEELEAFSSVIDPEQLGYTALETTERDAVVDWVLGRTGSGREEARLGDIGHSSPAVVVAPPDDLADESFNLFRARPEVRNRPPVVYVASNDGIMHAFAAAAWDPNDFGGVVSDDARKVDDGEEIWGFIPPYLLPSLQDTLAARRPMFDGAPLVHELFYTRLPGASPSANDYHTVMVVGLRGGGNAYLAMDITDPFDPKFLWQFTHPKMGAAYGQPTFAQVNVEIDGTLHQRGVVILPGGEGELDSADPCVVPTEQVPPTPINGETPRTSRRCWKPEGRQLWVVDVATGAALAHFDEDDISAPLTGGVSAFTGEVGTIATRAFVSDEDGVIWRLDMTRPDPDAWTFKPFYDIFGDQGPTVGSPGYNPPIITVNADGDVVVIQGTGDIDQLDNVAMLNRVVSLTEKVTFGSGLGGSTIQVSLNWENTLDVGEQVTGPLELFSGKVYYATFKSSSDPNNACGFGEGRICGVHFVDNDGASPPGPEPGLANPSDPSLIDTTCFDPMPNQIVMGVRLTQRPRCTEDVDQVWPYNHRTVSDVAGGDYELVALVSGDGGTAQAGSNVSEISIALPQPDSPSRILSWTGAARE